MADDAAAPDGELNKSTSKSDSAPIAEKTASDAVETESGAVELTEPGDATSTVAQADTEVAEDSEADVDADVDVDADDAEDYDGELGETAVAGRTPMSHVKLALIAGLTAVVALAGLTGWLGFRAYESSQAQDERNLFLQVGRQGALNLTTINWENADADIQRILDSATGTFYDDFQQRAEPFLQVVKQAQSKSVGTISEAGLESEGDNQAEVLVAVSVETTNAGAPEQAPRAWRMRISVEKVGDEAKVSNVEFVP
ncbi:Mce protein [Mycolicibacterium sp. CR10]|uniref:Mce protein n=1 Tax=Mycolicibacterium sp. CR10 TaxID=2562314 RepID=UPI0010C0569F|nr:Mce protein [Mycolicibacterium sp. CR10]